MIKITQYLHDATLSFFKILFYVVYGYSIFFLGKKYWGTKNSISYSPENPDNLPKLNREYWFMYENLKKSSIIINENKYNLTYFPFIVVFYCLIIKFSLFDIIKLIF